MKFQCLSERSCEWFKQELRTKQTSASPNMDEVNSLIDDKNTLEAQVEKNRAAQGLKMRALLTPEQKTELDRKIKAQMAERKQMRGERKEMKLQKESTLIKSSL